MRNLLRCVRCLLLRWLFRTACIRDRLFYEVYRCYSLSVVCYRVTVAVAVVTNYQNVVSLAVSADAPKYFLR
jgi:hypothetical protein